MKPGLARADDAPYPGAYLRALTRQNAGSGLVSTLPGMVALIRSLPPNIPTLRKPDKIKADDDEPVTRGGMDTLCRLRRTEARGTGSRER